MDENLPGAIYEEESNSKSGNDDVGGASIGASTERLHPTINGAKVQSNGLLRRFTKDRRMVLTDENGKLIKVLMENIVPADLYPETVIVGKRRYIIWPYYTVKDGYYIVEGTVTEVDEDYNPILSSSRKKSAKKSVM